MKQLKTSPANSAKGTVLVSDDYSDKRIEKLRKGKLS
jgi:hypothetical protein